MVCYYIGNKEDDMQIINFTEARQKADEALFNTMKALEEELKTERELFGEPSPETKAAAWDAMHRAMRRIKR